MCDVDCYIDEYQEELKRDREKLRAYSSSNINTLKDKISDMYIEIINSQGINFNEKDAVTKFYNKIIKMIK